MNIFASDPVIGITYQPHARAWEKGKEYNAFYEINSLGLRDREYGTKKEGTFRVLLIGDSFSVSHGLPIEDSLSRQMEKALQEVTDSNEMNLKFEVINCAVGGYSPYNYWKAYHRWAPVFNPDLVLVGLSPDDYDCSNEEATYLIENGEVVALVRNGQAATKPRGLSLRKLRKWLSRNSEFYILMRNFFYYNDLVGHLTLRARPGGVEDEFQLQTYMVAKRDTIRYVWSKTFTYLEKLRQETASDSVPLVLISNPLKMEIDSEQYRQVLATKGLKPEQFDLEQPLTAIADFSKTKHIPLLDPRMALRKRQTEFPCYFVLDGHWNAEGIRVAAISLGNQLRELGLVPSVLPHLKPTPLGERTLSETFAEFLLICRGKLTDLGRVVDSSENLITTTCQYIIRSDLSNCTKTPQNVAPKMPF